MFLSRRGYHPHVNTAWTPIKSSGFILTFEYLDHLFNGTLDNELRFGHYFQSFAKIELISSVLRWWEQRGLGEGHGAGNLPTFSAPPAGEGQRLSPQQFAQILKGVSVAAHLPHRILVWLISQYLHSSVKMLQKCQL